MRTHLPHPKLATAQLTRRWRRVLWLCSLVCLLPNASAQAPANAEPVTPPWGSVQRISTPRQQADLAYRQALMGLQSGPNLNAPALLQQALRLDPDHHTARLLLAAVRLASDNAQAAQTVLIEGWHRTPRHTAFAMALAQMDLQSGQWAAAADRLQSALPVAVDHADFWALLAAVRQQQGRHAEAIQHYVTALRHTPRQATWLVGLGISLQAQGMRTPALEAYQQGLDGGLPPVLAELAHARLHQLTRPP